jgi:hypothetical protein
MVDVLPQVKSKKRRITLADVEEMAKLMAKRITETGACLIIGIKPETWFTFKSRGNNNSKFSNILARVRESQLKSHLENIESFQVKDWRASHVLLQLKAPERFGAQQGASQQAITAIISDTAMRSIMDRLYPKPSQVVDIEEVKQVQDKQ